MILPEAELAVARHRARLDSSAAYGVAAHVTVLAPFVDPDHVDGTAIERLAAAVSTVPAFDVAFRRTAWFGEDVLWLAPDPAQPFRDLTAAVVAAFPDHPPYAGAHDGSAPHLTIGERRLGDLTALRRAEQEVSVSLPLESRAERVCLLAWSDAPDSCSILHEVPLS